MVMNHDIMANSLPLSLSLSFPLLSLLLSPPTQSIVHSSTIEEPSGDTPTHKQTDPYILCSPIQCTATERALLLAFSLKWRRETDTVTAEQLKEFEKEIWLSHIHATIEEMESLVSCTSLPFHLLPLPNPPSPPQTTTPPPSNPCLRKRGSSTWETYRDNYGLPANMLFVPIFLLHINRPLSVMM